jgi:membrane-associated protease RseP (regulator of RpoE activity)
MDDLQLRPRPRIWLNVLLFGLTLLSTFFVGLGWGLSYVHAEALSSSGPLELGLRALTEPPVVLLGCLYAVVLMIILTGHELGHYLTCRRYGLSATLPYFMPFPTLIGTLGAFIKIKSPIRYKSHLFDIGANGPLAGFTLAVPALTVGLAFSKLVPSLPEEGAIIFGEPLAFNLLEGLFFAGAPAGSALVLHPVAFAGWVGLLVTSLNLLPFGQLDGGHIAYALIGARAKFLSRALIAAFLVMGFYFWAGWLLWAAVLLVIGIKHPRIVDEGEPLSRKRQVLSLLIIAIFILSFIPDPVRGFDLRAILKSFGAIAG